MSNPFEFQPQPAKDTAWQMLMLRLGVTRRTVINREAGRLITAEAELAISALSKPTGKTARPPLL